MSRISELSQQIEANMAQAQVNLATTEANMDVIKSLHWWQILRRQRLIRENLELARQGRILAKEAELMMRIRQHYINREAWWR